jgi:hypothetical protein
MKSSMPGTSTLKVEVTNISSFGFWILLNEKEHFLSFTNFPWFKKATIDEICDVQALTDEHLFWKTMDIDLELSSIISPEKYPLIYKKA